MATFSNDSKFEPQLSQWETYMRCLKSEPSSFIYISYSIASILFSFPLCVLVLKQGLREWKKKRSSSSSFSHSDVFTYHLTIFTLAGLLGNAMSCVFVLKDTTLLYIGKKFQTFAWYAETYFHQLTCGERYLAVVHPVIYRAMRTERGVRVRNLAISCVWLFCVTAMALDSLGELIFVNLVVVMSTFISVTFCSLSVLCVLIRPGPGEQGGHREKVDRSKQRAFYTMLAILGALVLKSVGDLLWVSLFLADSRANCLFLTCWYWTLIPSSLVLPLLFLHRAKKLTCCQENLPVR